MPKPEKQEASDSAVLPDDLSFEEAFARLERIVADMESAQLPLSEVIRNFRNARRLAAFCQDKLGGLKQQIELLVRDSESGQTWRELDPNDISDRKQTDFLAQRGTAEPPPASCAEEGSQSDFSDADDAPDEDRLF